MERICHAILGGLIALQVSVADGNGDISFTIEGYAVARASNNATQMQEFVGRAVSLFGGRVIDDAGLATFSRIYSSSDKQFDDLLSEVMLHPRWATWDKFAACVANRKATPAVVGQGIAYACSNMKYFNCSKVPAACATAAGSIWVEADYIFSVYFNEIGGAAFPTCHMGGAAIFQPASAYLPPAVRAKGGCIATTNPLTTSITDEGYHAVIGKKNTTQTKTLILRMAASRLSGEIRNEAQLQDWSSKPPQNFQSLLQWLPALLDYPTFSGTISCGVSWGGILGVYGLLQLLGHTQ